MDARWWIVTTRLVPPRPSTGSPAMRFIVADWGTAHFRGYLIENETVLDQISSNEGVSALQKRSASRCVPESMRAMARDRARRAGAPRRHGGKPRGLARGAVRHLPRQARPRSPRHWCRWIWRTAAEAKSSPGLFCEPAPGASDVVRGEETPASGAGIENGLICSAGTHPKWIEIRTAASIASPPT